VGLRLKHRARVDQALRDVPDLLMHLEQRGWQDRRLWELRKSDPVTAASLERLGVTSLWSQRPTLKHPPGFYLMPEPWGSWEQGIESLPAFVSDLLAEPQGGRLRRQLADAQVDERHAFLLLGWEHMESLLLHSRETRELPAAAPKLPEPIDGLWVASGHHSSCDTGRGAGRPFEQAHWCMLGGWIARRVPVCVSSSDLAPLVVMNIGSSVPAGLKAWGDNPAAWTG
jgi:hypothetical protein